MPSRNLRRAPSSLIGTTRMRDGRCAVPLHPLGLVLRSFVRATPIPMGLRFIPIACTLTLGACAPSSGERREATESRDTVQNTATSAAANPSGSTAATTAASPPATAAASIPDVARARQRRVFFAHHSVGKNLLDGAV